MGDWQPISTCPLNKVCWFLTEEGEYYGMLLSPPDEWEADAPFQPTHWMPYIPLDDDLADYYGEDYDD